MLGKSGVRYETRRFFEELPTRAEVESIVRRLPNGVHDLLSTRSTRYRELKLAERNLTDAEILDLLVAEPGLWRRSVIVTPKGVQVGYNEEGIKAILP